MSAIVKIGGLIVGVVSVVLTFAAYIAWGIAYSVLQLNALMPQVGPDLSVQAAPMPSQLLTAAAVGFAAAVVAALMTIVLAPLLQRAWPRIAWAVLAGPVAFWLLVAVVALARAFHAGWVNIWFLDVSPSSLNDVLVAAVVTLLPALASVSALAWFVRLRPPSLDGTAT